MSWRPRSTDWLLAGGVVLLLVGAPSYFAASDATKALDEHEPVAIRELHVGDRADLAFFFTTPHGTFRSPAALRLEVLAADDPAHPDAAYLLRWSQHAMDVETAGLSYASRAAVAEILLDDEGAPVWYRFERADPAQPAQLPGEATVRNVHRFGMGELVQPTPLLQAPETFLYRPDAVERVVGGLERAFGASATAPGSAPDEAARAFVAAEVEERLLLGSSPRSHTPTTMPAAAQDGVAYRGPIPNLTLDHPLATTLVTPTTPIAWTESVAWTWYTPDLGTTAGFHQEWHGIDGVPLVTVDLVPVDIVHGERPIPRWQGEPPSPGKDPETIPLGELQSRRAILHQNLSLADLHATLTATDAPDEIRTFMEAGGRITEYSFQRTDRLSRTIVFDQKFPGLAPSVSPYDVIEATWRLTLSNDRGDIRIAHVEVKEALAAQEHHFTVRDGCDPATATGPARPDCRARAPHDTTPHRLVVPPDVILRTLAADHEARGAALPPPASFHYLPLMEVAPDGTIEDPVYRFPGRWTAESVAGLGWGTRPTSSGMALERRDGSQDRIYHDLQSGRAVYLKQVVVEETEPEEPSTPTTLEATATAPGIITGLDPQLILSGIFLVALSVSLRLVFWLWPGTLWKAIGAFFSRIAPTDALRHEARADIVDLLRADPGMSLKEVQERLDLGWGTAVHHMQILESTGHVKSVHEGRTRHFFAGDHWNPAEMNRTIAARKSHYATFLEIVARHPGIGLDEITERLERDRAGVSRTGSRLAALGLVTKQREGKRVAFHPNSAA